MGEQEFLYTHEDLSLNCQHPHKTPGMATCSCYSNAVRSRGREGKMTGACWHLAGKQRHSLSQGLRRRVTGDTQHPPAPLSLCMLHGHP